MSTFNISQKLATPPADVAVSIPLNSSADVFEVPANSFWRVYSFTLKDAHTGTDLIAYMKSPSGVKITLGSLKTDGETSLVLAQVATPDASREVRFKVPLLLAAGWKLGVTQTGAATQTRNFMVSGEFIENTL